MATLGQELKQQREARGKSLEEVSKTTNIAARFLHAIERDDYRELPGELYNRSFIRQLAKAIDYDEARALQLYERQSGSSRIPTDEEVSRAPEMLPPPKTGNALLLTLSVAVVVVVVAGTSYAFPGWWTVFGRLLASLKPSPVAQAPSAPAPPGQEPATEAAPASPSPAPPPPSDGLTLELRANGKCWTRLQLDDGKPEEFILLPDDVRLYRAKEKIVLSLGALQSVSVAVNGRPLQLPSRDGITVRRAVITPDTLETGLIGGLAPAAGLQ